MWTTHQSAARGRRAGSAAPGSSSSPGASVRRAICSAGAFVHADVLAEGIDVAQRPGHATGWSIEAAASLTVRPTRWLYLRLDARYTPVVLSFAANGTRYARSATDQWMSGLLEVGFAL